MAFTNCHDRGLNLLPPDERAIALPTQPIRLAKSYLAITFLMVCPAEGEDGRGSEQAGRVPYFPYIPNDYARIRHAIAI